MGDLQYEVSRASWNMKHEMETRDCMGSIKGISEGKKGIVVTRPPHPPKKKRTHTQHTRPTYRHVIHEGPKIGGVSFQNPRCRVWCFPFTVLKCN